MHAPTSPRCADPAPHWRQELVEALVCEATRPEARAKLDKLRASSAKQTASNKVKLDGERRALREAVETQAREGRERAAERQRAEALAAAEQQEAKARLQERMAAGEATGAEARAEMRERKLNAATTTTATAPPAAAAAPAAVEYAPSRPHPLHAARATAQPLDPSQVVEEVGFMTSALLLQREGYEDNPEEFRKVRMAGGHKPTSRSGCEAFDVGALLFGLQHAQ